MLTRKENSQGNILYHYCSVEFFNIAILRRGRFGVLIKFIFPNMNYRVSNDKLIPYIEMNFEK